MSEPHAGKEYAIRRLREVARPDLRWRARVPAGALPGGPMKITAWAFDAEEGKAYKLGGSHVARRR